jgi:HK97 gp10 family phage protein
MAKITLGGHKELQKQFKRLAKSLDPDKVEPIFMQSAAIIRDEAISNVESQTKEKTGNLRKSIKAKKWKRKGEEVTIVLAAVDRKIAPHAHLLEYGTQNMSARPFFAPAVDAKSGEAEKHFTDGMRKLIEEVAR